MAIPKLGRKAGFGFASVLFLFSIASDAEGQKVESAPDTSKQLECTSELFENADRTYELRRLRNNAVLAESYLKKIIAVCPDAEMLTEVRTRLNTLQEESADRSLYIAEFYLRRFREKGTGLKGSQSRLRYITEKYPDYSKSDQVIYMLAETYLFEENFGKALCYFQDVLDRFPDGEYAQLSKSKIEIIRNECLQK